ncbi:winged helix-turn-helix domain-containing protein [Micromonospora sp. NPDC049580]|uniref:winged helix-turn-helix domain-containing protein n=1 Tax=Micromonospora sp. NPDC049580 TaxID=3154832 RepID=UPI00341B37A6
MYQQVADALRASITSGAIAPGQLLPSSRVLEQTYGVSRETVRRTLAVLRAEGLVVTEPSLGTRVRAPEQRRQVAVQRGATVISRPATAAERREHGMTVGEHVQVISLGGRVVGVHPADRVELTIR